MNDIFYLRPVDPPVSPGDLTSALGSAVDCFDLHRVHWKMSFLVQGGGEILCWYQAPDAESARIALRSLGSDMNAVWVGELLSRRHNPEADLENCNAFASVPTDNQAAIQTLFTECPDDTSSTQRAELIEGIRLVGSQTIVCLFRTPDPPTVLEALEKVGITPSSLRPCTAVLPGARNPAMAEGNRSGRADKPPPLQDHLARISL